MTQQELDDLETTVREAVANAAPEDPDDDLAVGGVATTLAIAIFHGVNDAVDAGKIVPDEANDLFADLGLTIAGN